MKRDSQSAVYGSYNARSVEPRLVAEWFVAPPQFWEIVTEGNAVLTGPRGSGKTTLLKMLVTEALEHWEDEDAQRARDSVTYTGVFVPADRSWSGQVEAVSSGLEPELRTSLGLASFALHALRALSASAATRVSPPHHGSAPHGRVSMDRETEASIANAVHKHWGLDSPVGSFSGLRFALSDALVSLGQLARRARRDPQAMASLRQSPLLDLDPVEAMIPFIERFNHAAGDEAHVWTFLIDEIEFLPPLIRAEILRLMRGRDPRVMQKLSLAPYTSVSTQVDPLGAWEGHDFKSIDLTFSDKEEGYEFNEALVAADLERRELAISPYELFGGQGSFESVGSTDAYDDETGDNARHIRSLADKDAGFATWLTDHGIDPRNLSETAGMQRAATLRKAMPIVTLRDEFLHSVRGQLARRSRKNPQIYNGAESAYAICEGNPRLLKALVARLVRLNAADDLDDSKRATAIHESSRQYELHLRALALPASLPEKLLPRHLIATIGNFFEDGVLAQSFDPEPPLSFTIDPRHLGEPGLSEVLFQLIHAGAIVPLGNERYRLAHMFAPIYRLPLRKGRAISLASILNPRQRDDQPELSSAE